MYRFILPWKWKFLQMKSGKEVILFWSEVKSNEVSEVSYVEVLRGKSSVHKGDHSLRVLDCIVTILFGVYLVLWLF